jgi:hypothetical protein
MFRTRAKHEKRVGEKRSPLPSAAAVEVLSAGVEFYNIESQSISARPMIDFARARCRGGAFRLFYASLQCAVALFAKRDAPADRREDGGTASF